MKKLRGARAGQDRRMTPIGAVADGLLAGAVGTLAMDLVLFARHRSSGGQSPFLRWEFSAVDGWEPAPAPAQVGKRLLEGLFRRELPDRQAGAVNNATHWGY